MFKGASLTSSPPVDKELDGDKAGKRRKFGFRRSQTFDTPSSPRESSPRLKGKNIIRVCVLGSSKVGKTSIVRRMLGQAFVMQHIPTVYESHIKQTKIGENDVTLDVQDMAGSMNFPVMEKCAVENANVILIVFALDDFQSCEHAVNLSLHLEESETNRTVMLVGNKSDLFKGSEESRNKIEEFINKSVKRTYIQMSAKFDRYAKQLLKEIYEAYEVARGPSRVKVVRRGILSRLSSTTQPPAGSLQELDVEAE